VKRVLTSVGSALAQPVLGAMVTVCNNKVLLEIALHMGENLGNNPSIMHADNM
jgi:hypothetical protein